MVVTSYQPHLLPWVDARKLKDDPREASWCSPGENLRSGALV
jgi:hypothetical protein